MFMKKIAISVLCVGLLLGVNPIFAKSEIGDVDVNTQMMDSFINRARDIYSEEIVSNDSKLLSVMRDDSKSFQYQFVDTKKNIIYAYENDNGEERVGYLLYEDEDNLNDVQTFVDKDLQDGIGGRQYIKGENIQSIEGDIELPGENEIYLKDYLGAPAYIYTGFVNDREEDKNNSSIDKIIDMGLQYSERNGGTSYLNKGWKPVMLFRGTSDWKPAENYDKVQFKNSFIPGTTVEFKAWPAFADDFARLKLVGRARYSEPDGTGEPKSLIAVLEADLDQKVTRPNKAKLLATIAVPKGSKIQPIGRFKTTFKYLEMNRSTIAERNYLEPETDKARVYRNGDRVTISVDSNR